MKPDRWPHVKHIVADALEMPRNTRNSYLDSACAGDTKLRGEVDRLLAAHDEAGPQFLDTANWSETSQQNPEAWLGRTLGQYQIVEEIGCGGMGEVFRATRTDNQYTKEVAIKLVRTDSGAEFLCSRFRTERQILANLDHPFIARLYDAGTTDEGLPYVLMELVRGVSITQYCQEHQLSIRARLELFLKVCDAVQYAHQQLVVHRDLKPANILVTPDGAPKLLDFGIAKILDSAEESSQKTGSLFRLLTPAYASPEQINDGLISTASDVYSLGVILFELLTGRSPYVDTNPQDIARAVRETDPPKPSTVVLRVSAAKAVSADALHTAPAHEISAKRLAKRLRGDLDNIVLMALRKEPLHRYASVEQLAGDLRRHLLHLPVRARNDALAYRCSKFIKRHRAAVAAAALVTVTATCGYILTLREARIAERRFNDVRALATSMVFDIHDTVRDLPGATPIRKLLVSRALNYLDRLSRESAGDASLQRELAAAYERVGDVQGNPFYPNLGDVHGALVSYRKSLEIRRQLLAKNPKDFALLRELSASYSRVGSALDGLKDFPAALASYQQALALLEGMPTSDDPKAQDQLAGAYYYVAIAAVETGDSATAVENASKAAFLRESIRTDDPGLQTTILTHLAGDYGSMGQILMSSGDIEGAIVCQQKAVAILRSLVGRKPADSTLKAFLGESQFYLAVALESRGNLLQALHSCKQAADIYDSLLSADPRNAFARQYLGLAEEVDGRILVKLGRAEMGLRSLNESIHTFDALIATDAKNPATLAGFGESYMGLGLAHLSLAKAARDQAAKADEFREALASFQKSLAIWRDLQYRNALDPLDRNKPEELRQLIATTESKPLTTTRRQR